MALKNYIANGPLTVILDDDRDPDVSWANHLARAGRGGVDTVAKVGTPIYAPTAGWLDHRPNDGGAGNSTRFRHRDNPGWKDVFSHLSSYVGASGQFFERGALIAYSGNSGGVTQHLHRHLLDPNDNRQNPWHYFAGSDPAGGGTPIPLGDDMPILELVQSRTGAEGVFYAVNRVARYHVPNPATLADYQYFISVQRIAGNLQAKPDVQIVANLSAFGPIVK